MSSIRQGRLFSRRFMALLFSPQCSWSKWGQFLSRLQVPTRMIKLVTCQLVYPIIMWPYLLKKKKIKKEKEKKTQLKHVGRILPSLLPNRQICHSNGNQPSMSDFILTAQTSLSRWLYGIGCKIILLVSQLKGK